MAEKEFNTDIKLINSDVKDSQGRDVLLKKIDTFTNLPAAGESDGDSYLVLDENTIYEWEQQTNIWKPIEETRVRTINSNTTLTSKDRGLIKVDTSNNDVVITLPSAAGYEFELHIKKTHDNNRVYINPIEGQTIDDNGNIIILYKNTNIPLISDDANWCII
jgi:hypothetical protein